MKDKSFAITSEVYVEMKKDNVISPYVFRKVAMLNFDSVVLHLSLQYLGPKKIQCLTVLNQNTK